jgi:hypothetical protein
MAGDCGGRGRPDGKTEREKDSPMHTHFHKLSAVAAATIVSLGMAGFAGAAQYQKPMTQNCVDQKTCAADQKTTASSMSTQTKQTQVNWKFDSTKQERSHHRSDRFRYEYGGFWYPAPYWMGYGLSASHRIDCGDGRAILRDHGFSTIRPVECRGGIYTYLGHRHGDSFRVLLSAKSGRIVNVKQI